MIKVDAPLHVPVTNISLYSTTVSAFVAMLIRPHPSIARLKSANAVKMAWGELGETWFMEKHQVA
jgi:hypothetical protein